ncbi:unnamed protein product [Calicophoron daubneyi]|uniref:Acyltransferase n=1 Tax=Calicophoron daubneyi TaxID=300641 RepID=A0AAV2T1W7_CALDB
MTEVQLCEQQKIQSGNKDIPLGTIIVQPEITGDTGVKYCFQRCASFVAVLCVFTMYFLAVSLPQYFLWLFIYRTVNFFATFMKPAGSVTDTAWESLPSPSAIWFVILLYLTYYCLDWGVADVGGRGTQFMRNLALWKYCASYFPVRLALSDELVNYAKEHAKLLGKTDGNTFPGLPNDKTYLLGYHPHGMFSIGATINFLTEANRISQIFPGIKPWVATFAPTFNIPILREFILWLGAISVSRKGLFYLLDPDNEKNRGNLVLVVVGGAPEMLNSHPGCYRLVIRRRFGFFKLALQTGSALIPCISFGESGVYDQFSNPPSSLLRRVQNFFMDSTRIPIPLLVPLGLGPYPLPKPITTVIGAPIPCDRIDNPTTEQIVQLREVYIKRMEGLFRRYKPAFDPDAEDIEFGW